MCCACVWCVQYCTQICSFIVMRVVFNMLLLLSSSCVSIFSNCHVCYFMRCFLFCHNHSNSNEICIVVCVISRTVQSCTRIFLFIVMRLISTLTPMKFALSCVLFHALCNHVHEYFYSLLCVLFQL